MECVDRCYLPYFLDFTLFKIIFLPLGQVIRDTPEVAKARRQHLAPWELDAQFNSRAAETVSKAQQQHFCIDFYLAIS